MKELTHLALFCFSCSTVEDPTCFAWQSILQ